MGKSVSKSGKLSKKARKKIARRNKLIRTGLIYFALLAVCIGCLVMMPVINRAQDRQNTWAMQNGGVEIDPSQSVEPAQDEAEPAGEGEAYAITLEDVPSPATAEPTEAPTPEPTPEPTEAPTPEPTAIPSDVTITITAAGDCTFGGCLKHDTLKVFKKYVDQHGYTYFFDKVRSIFEQDDLTIINLEGPLTDVGTMTNKSSICFCGDPAWTGIMTCSSVELCNMANNHSMDMGKEGMLRTAQALDEAGIGYCAYSKVYNTTIKGVRITALGFDKWNNSEKQVVEAVRRERANCDILIVNMHWGWEMHYEPMKEQKSMGHAIINAGADLVIGTHPHVFGGVELYKGKYICYSLGNFCFGGHTNPSDKRAMMFQQTFVVSPGGEVSDGGINILPCMVSGTTKTNDFQPYVLGAKAGASLLKRIASYSNLSGSTKWMPGSYPELIGLIPKSQATRDMEAAGTAQPNDTAQPGGTVQPDTADQSQEALMDGLPPMEFEDEASLISTEFAESAGDADSDWEEMDGADLSLEDGAGDVLAP